MGTSFERPRLAPAPRATRQGRRHQSARALGSRARRAWADAVQERRRSERGLGRGPLGSTPEM